jgi:HK97 family phage major capsid protein
MEKAADEQVTLDEAQSEEYDTIEDDVKKIDAHLVRLRRQEEYNKQQAIVVGRVDDAQAASDTRAGKPVRAEVISVRRPMEKGLGILRVALARFGARNEGVHPGEYARQLYPQYPDIEMAVRAAINPGTTTDTTWAAPLVVYQNLQGEMIELLFAASIIGRVNGLRRVPFKIKLPRQTGGATVNWVGETKVKPVSQLAFDSITMDHHKIAGIVPLSEELWRLSNPSAEALVRDALINEITEKMDRDFVDPTKAEESGVSPASITNGVSAVTATGTTAAALRADVKTLFSTMASNNLSTASGHWIMTQQQAIAISMMVTSLSQPEFPGITPTGGTFYGFPVVASENIPATGGSPTDGYPLIFALANQILLADDGSVAIDVSREASLQMDSAPDSPPTASTTLVSLWQHNLVAVKGERWITWKKARDTAVGYIQNAKYAE